MSLKDKARNKVDEAKAKSKEKAGRAQGDKHREAEGKSDRAVADVKQAGEKMKDAFRH